MKCFNLNQEFDIFEYEKMEMFNDMMLLKKNINPQIITILRDKEGIISEMEVELYSGSREDMEAFGEMLTSKFNLVPENRSKFKQGLELQL